MIRFQDNIRHSTAPPDSLPDSDEAQNPSTSLYMDISDDPGQPQFLHTLLPVRSVIILTTPIL